MMSTKQLAKLTPGSTKVRISMQCLPTDNNTAGGDDRQLLDRAIESLERTAKRTHSPSKSEVKRRRISSEAYISTSPHKRPSAICPEIHIVRLILEDVIRLEREDRIVVACDSESDCKFRRLIDPDLSDGSIVRSSCRRRKEIFECDAIVVDSGGLPTEMSTESMSFYTNNNLAPDDEPSFTVMLLPARTVLVRIYLRDVIDSEIEVWRTFGSYFQKRDFRVSLSKKNYRSSAQMVKRLAHEISGCLIQSQELLVAAIRARAYIDQHKSGESSTQQHQPQQQSNHLISPLATLNTNGAGGRIGVSPDVSCSPLLPKTLSIRQTIHNEVLVLGTLDKYFQVALQRLYGGYLKGCQTLFNPGEEDSMLRDFETQLSSHAEDRYSIIFSQRELQPDYQATHVKEIRQKKLRAMYSFFANCRQRNNQLMPHFAAAHALCNAAKGQKDCANDSLVRKGYAMTYANAFNLSDTMAEKGNAKMQRTLGKETFVSASIDNFQQFKQKKNQRNGKSVSALHGTQRYLIRSKRATPPIGSVFVEKEAQPPVEFVVENVVQEGPYESRLLIRNHETRDSTKTILYPNSSWRCIRVYGSPPLPELTYVDQKIPPSFLFCELPLFETSSTTSPDPDDSDSCDGGYDFTDGDQTIEYAYFDHNDSNIDDTDRDYDVDTEFCEAEHADDDVFDEDDASQGQDVTLTTNVTNLSTSFTVEDYGENVETATVMAELQRYACSATNEVAVGVKGMLKRCRPLIMQSKTYQKRMMRQCNPFNGEVSEIFVLPMSKYDEISKVGCMQVIFELLTSIGFAKQEGDWFNPARDDIHDIKLQLNVDYLTAKNIRAIKSDLRTKLTQPGSETFVLNALDCLKPIRVHQAQFHTNMHQVDAIQRFFYGGLIQVAQAVLGWKRIQFKSLERFQVTVKLHDLMYEELTRCYVEGWSADLVERGSVVDRTNKDGISNVLLSDLLSGEVDDKTVLRLLADDYKRFIHPFHTANTNDEYVNFLGQFHFLTGKRRAYFTAMREGDFLVTELQHVSWLLPFAAAKKHQYAESALECCDTLLNMDALEREDVRRNMGLRLNENRRMLGQDEEIEIINLGSTKFQNSDTIDGVARKSQFVLAGAACARSLEPTSNKLKSSTDPGALAERKALHGLFGSMEPTKPSGRKLTSDGCWLFYQQHQLVSAPPTSDSIGEDTNNAAFLRLRNLFTKLSKRQIEPIEQSEEEVPDESTATDDDGEDSDGAEDNEEGDENNCAGEHDTTKALQNMKRYTTQTWLGRVSIRVKGLKVLGKVKEKRAKAKADDAKEWGLIEQMVRNFQQSSQDCEWEYLCKCDPDGPSATEWAQLYSQHYVDGNNE